MKMTITDSPNLSEIPIIYLKGYWIAAWGHFLLDDLFTLFKFIKNLNLSTYHILITDEYNRDIKYHSNIEIMRAILKPEHLYFGNNSGELKLNYVIEFEGTIGIYASEPGAEFCRKYLVDFFSNDGFKENQKFYYPNKSELLREYRDLFFKTYGINETVDEKLITFVNRKGRRVLKNAEEIKNLLISNGFKVEIVYFEDMTVEQEIRQVARSKYLIGIYGTNLANALFLQSEKTKTSVIILWPKLAKYFMKRYDIMQAVILATNSTMVEYDKSKYDSIDEYIHYDQPYSPDDWIVKGNRYLSIKDSFMNPSKILDYPLACPYDFFDVGLYVECDILDDIIKNIDRNIITIS